MEAVRMPVYKVQSLHSSKEMGGCIDYITDIAKTMQGAAQPDIAQPAGRYVTAVNLSSLAAAAQEMAETRARSMRRRTHYGYHLVQSFVPGAPVTPALAHEIGCEMAARIFPGHQAVVATHLNRPHLHTHIAANSVSCDTDQVVQYPRGVWRSVTALARYHGTILLPRYGLEELQYGQRKELEIPWQERHWKGVREDVNLDIRQAASRASSRDGMLAELAAMGYETVRNSTKDALRPQGGTHFWHIDRFYRDWEISAMTAGGQMRAVWQQEQSAIAAEVWPHSPHDTKNGMMTSFEAQILYWFRILRTHDRLLHPELPHQVQRELRRTMKAFKEIRRTSVRSENEIDALIEDMLAQCADLSRRIKEAPAVQQKSLCSTEGAAEMLREKRRALRLALRHLRDAKRAANLGLGADYSSAQLMQYRGAHNVQLPSY